MFTGRKESVDWPCPECGEYKVVWYEWESSDEAYTDYKYTCDGCGNTWWIEGIDS